MTLLIRRLEVSDSTAWLELWNQYLVFYNQSLSNEQTQLTWNRLLADAGPIYARVAELDEKVVGFTHYSFTHSTWEHSPAVYVEDLFVSPSSRNSGVARALAAELESIAVGAGSRRLHWITQHHNVTARKLYDELGELTDFIVYEKNLG